MGEQHSSKSVERFIFFSDAVFAFALTLLAVELKLPPHEHKLTYQALLAALAGSKSGLICYFISYFVVASMWIRHHRLFEAVRNYDRQLILLNFAMLFCVSLIPFAIEVLRAVESIQLGTAIYCGTLTVIGVAAFALWWHMQRTPGLLEVPLTGRAFLKECVLQLEFPVSSGAIAVAALSFSDDNFVVAIAGIAVLVTVVRKLSQRFLATPPAPLAA